MRGPEPKALCRAAAVALETGWWRGRFAADLRAAVAAGIDALFIETHPDIEAAPCDGPSQISFEELDRLLAEPEGIGDEAWATELRRVLAELEEGAT